LPEPSFLVIVFAEVLPLMNRSGDRQILDRREFAALVPALMALGTMIAEPAGAQTVPDLPTVTSGVYPPKPGKAAPGAQRVSQSYLKGMLTAGNIQIEMHETTQQPHAEHEAIGTHKHSEIWLVREGTVNLMTNGVVRVMKPGDVGICAAGDEHYVANGGDTPCTYFVVTVGPQE
jgi:mannose-6-phosphate isomerase-like protein (cupin superfamily)